MFHKIILTLAGVIMFVTSTSAADYMFPSRQPPPGNDPADIPQYISLIWDDNAYSGLKGTPYETAPGQEWSEISRVEGDTYQFKPWHSSKNEFNLKEGDIGMSWAVRTLAGTRKNPDGSKITMTFNVISGQMAPVTWKTKWVEDPQEDDVWGWKKKTYVTVSWASVVNPPIKTVLAPVCWGREYETFTNGGSDTEEEPHTVRMYTEIMESGHEIGNHTIDHMETNSGLTP